MTSAAPVGALDAPSGSCRRARSPPARGRRGHDLVAAAALGAGVEDHDVVLAPGLRQAVDRLALLVGARVAAGGHHDADAASLVQRQLDLGQAAVDARPRAASTQVALQARQHDLGLGVAEAAVELEHARPRR